MSTTKTQQLLLNLESYMDDLTVQQALTKISRKETVQKARLGADGIVAVAIWTIAEFAASMERTATALREPFDMEAWIGQTEKLLRKATVAIQERQKP